MSPDLVILEIGLNDILMGAMMERIELNVSRIVEGLAAARITVLLAGMVLPPMGEPDGESAFADIYPRVAAANGLGLIPGFNAPPFKGPGRLQYDGLHPTSRGYEAIADHALPWVVAAIEEAMAG